MNKKTLLVLAASIYQIPTIATAKRLEYRVITTDDVPSNPGHALSDQSYGVSTIDQQAVLEIARQENIDGIIAPCTDVAVPTSAYVAEQLGLQGVPLECANTVFDKIAFREFLNRHAFPAPKSYPITLNYQPNADLFRHSWIMKPDRSSGSKGIFIVRSLSDFYQYLPETLRFSPTARGILEEFIDGFQGTCEGIVNQGELALTFILDRRTVNPPHVATCGHHLPSALPPQLQEKLLVILKKIWHLLGVTDGLFDCDFVATENEIYILEISPRLGGNSIATLLKKATGFNIVEYSVKQACGEVTHLPTTVNIRPTSVVLLGVEKEGRLSYNQTELEALRQEVWVDSLSIDFAWGELVYPFIHGRNRVGEALIFGNNRNDLDNKVRELKQRLQLEGI
ncbi:MAG: ATP-grasp domain-containing protein [Leptolyngbyaceae cyanobacterium RU_5_1]|nr:ATP-grasp domain-containing protein [Leptolyngbyaceae cyanobacterium RU_5_1]